MGGVCACGMRTRSSRAVYYLYGLMLTRMVSLVCRLRAALATPGSKATDHLRQLGITPTSSKHSGAQLSAPLSSPCHAAPVSLHASQHIILACMRMFSWAGGGSVSGVPCRISMERAGRRKAEAQTLHVLPIQALQAC